MKAVRFEIKVDCIYVYRGHRSKRWRDFEGSLVAILPPDRVVFREAVRQAQERGYLVNTQVDDRESWFRPVPVGAQLTLF